MYKHTKERSAFWPTLFPLLLLFSIVNYYIDNLKYVNLFALEIRKILQTCIITHSSPICKF